MALDFNPFENDNNLKAPAKKKKLTKIKPWENDPPGSVNSIELDQSKQNPELDPINHLSVSIGENTIANPAIVDDLPHETISKLDSSEINNSQIESQNTNEEGDERLPFVESPAIGENAIANFAIAQTTIEEFEITDFFKKNDDKIHKLNWEERKKETKQIIKKACQETKERSKKLGFVQVHNFIFDILFPAINNPSATIVYLLLYRRSWGYKNQPKVKISHQNIADKVGLSKRGVQDALDWLQEIGLIESKRRFHTDVPEHFVKRPWIDIFPIANPAIGENTIAGFANETSKICYSAIANFATTQIQDQKKVKETLSLEKFLNPTKILELECHWEPMMKGERESEKRQLIKLFKEKPDEANLICDAFQIVLKEQKADGKIKSAIAVLKTNYTNQYRKKALDEKNRQEKREHEKKTEAQNKETERKNALDKARKEQEETRLCEIKRQCFFEKYPTQKDRQPFIDYAAGKHPVFAHCTGGDILIEGLAIHNYWSNTEEGRAVVQKKLKELGEAISMNTDKLENSDSKPIPNYENETIEVPIPKQPNNKLDTTKIDSIDQNIKKVREQLLAKDIPEGDRKMLEVQIRIWLKQKENIKNPQLLQEPHNQYLDNESEDFE